jgi:hypothetical protein
MATVTFGVAFPGSGAKSLIHEDAATIEVEVFDVEFGPVATLTLTPADPTESVTLLPGFYTFTAVALDAASNPIEFAGTAGRVVAGPNSVVITFLNGAWTLETPITLSNGWMLDRFYLAFDEAGMGGPASFEPNVPKLMNTYVLTYGIDDGVDGLMGEARVRAYTQFGGGTVNRSTFDGGGYNLTDRCGESYDWPPPPGACPEGDGEQPGERWIRIVGDSGGDNCGDCSPGDRAVRALLPAESYEPDISGIADTRIVDGLTIAGTIIDYEFAGASEELVMGPFAASPSGAPMGPDPEFTLTVTGYDMAIVCEDGLNGGVTDGDIDTGGWDTSRPGPDADADSFPDYYEFRGFDGMFGVGECDLGLTWNVDTGEWCDGWWDGMSCDPGGADGVVLPWEFQDQDGNGVVDTGDFYFTHAVRFQFQVVGLKHAFVATGSQGGGSTITIQ